MSDDALHEQKPSAAGLAVHRDLLGRLGRLVLKELREILRDRRTIVTLVVMPILIYPLLAIVFQRFLLTSLPAERAVEYLIAVDSQRAGEALLEQLRAGEAALNRYDAADAAEPVVMVIRLSPMEARRHVIDSSIHLAILPRYPTDADAGQGPDAPTTWELVYRAGSPTSEAALHYVESRLQAFNELRLSAELERLGAANVLPTALERHPIAFTGTPVFSLAALIPLILVLMTVTGAVYPAIDVTAGERERGTLETLIAAPVPRVGLLMAKYVAVLTVALLTALVNLAAMTITAHGSGLAETLFGGMTLAVAGKVLVLLALFAAFFSAVLLALTSYARSFKEAQAYIIPLMLLCLVPGVVCLMPGLEFTPWMAVTPLVNIVMLARDLLEDGVVTRLAVAAVLSTLFYIAAAIALAARIFGTDAILYGSPATWSDLVRRPTEPQSAVGLPAAMIGLALMFAAYFVLGTPAAASGEFVILALVTALVFGGIPMVMVRFGRVRLSSGLGLRRAGGGALLAAAILGLLLWPVAHEVFLFSRMLGLSLLGAEQVEAARAMLVAWQGLPLGLILVTLAVVPGVVEELSFRGFLFSSLRTVLAEDRTVIASALLFGLFHEVLMPGRFLASTFVGLALGWVRLRSGSVLPCMLLHTLHNGLLLTIVYFRDQLMAVGWGVEEQAHLPATWLVAAALGIVLAMALMMATTPSRKTRLSEN